MLEFMAESGGEVIGVRATGTLTARDYERVLVPQLESRVARFGRARVLILMDEAFRGWNLKAALANTRLDLRFRGDLEKVAVVGAPAWEEWCVRLARPLMRGELRLFRRHELGEAWAWLRS